MIPISSIQIAVADHYRLPASVMLEKRGTYDRTRARHVAMHIAHGVGWSREEIAKEFACSIALVPAALRSVKRDMETQPKFKEEVEQLCQRIAS
jgi:chromosomal replication initiation ATPase DnaA